MVECRAKMGMRCESTHEASLVGMLSTSHLLFCLQSSAMPSVEAVLDPSLNERRINSVIQKINRGAYDGVALARGGWLGSAAAELALAFLVARIIDVKIMMKG
jgi:hypothetical protein